MVQCSHWDLVSSRPWTDKMNLWKAAVMRQSVLEQRTSPRAPRFQALALTRSSGHISEHKPQWVQVRVYKEVTAGTIQKCKWLSVLWAPGRTQSSCGTLFFLCSKAAEPVDRAVKTYFGAVAETSSCFHCQNSLRLPSGGPGPSILPAVGAPGPAGMLWAGGLDGPRHMPRCSRPRKETKNKFTGK